jgi:hypothetical protein
MIDVGIGVGILLIAMAIAKAIMGGSGSKKYSARQLPPQQIILSSIDRQKALDTYHAVVREKMDVIKTALAMGYTEDELTRLDARLESLIGKQQLEDLLKGNAPMTSAEMEAISLTREKEIVRGLKTAR